MGIGRKSSTYVYEALCRAQIDLRKRMPDTLQRLFVDGDVDLLADTKCEQSRLVEPTTPFSPFVERDGYDCIGSRLPIWPRFGHHLGKRFGQSE